MTFSVQQIKFEFLSYIKEFGADKRDWTIGTSADPEAQLFGSGLIDRDSDIWLWKPGLTPASAQMVLRFFTGFGVHAHDGGGAPGRCVYIFRRIGTSTGVASHAGRTGLTDA